MKRSFVKITVVAVIAMGIFTACDKVSEASSNYVGTWQSVGYYDNSPEAYMTAHQLIPDVSEKITFKKNGKGEYEANGSKKSFEWKAYEVGIEISISPSIHNDDNWTDLQREHWIESNKLTIVWSNKCEMVYEKIK